MEKKFCEQCGAEIIGAGKFCMKCGTPVPADKEPEAAAVQGHKAGTEEIVQQPVANTAVRQEAVNGGNVGTAQATLVPENVPTFKYKKCSAGATVFAVILCIFAFVAGVAANAMYFVKDFTSETVVKEVVQETVKELDIQKVGTELLSKVEIDGVEMKDDDLTGMIVENLAKSDMHVTEEEVSQLLEEQFIKDFLADKANDYVDDFLNETGTGVITEKELAELVKDNKEVIEDTLDITIEEEDIDKIEEYLVENVQLSEKTELAQIKKDADLPMKQIQIIFSLPLLIGLLAACALLFVLVFIIKGKPMRGLRPVGITLLLIGIVDLAAGLLSGRLPAIVDSFVGIGERYLVPLFTPIRSVALRTGGIVTGVGAVLIIAGIVVSAITASKTEK